MKADELQKGDIILVRGTGFISRMIQRFSGSAYSHIAIVVDDNEIIEAQGFRSTGYHSVHYYDGKTDVMRMEGLTEQQIDSIIGYLHEHVGGKYEYSLIFWQFIRYVFGFMSPYVDKPKEHICSTLVRDAYLQAGIDLTPWVKYPSPGDIAVSDYLKKIGEL